MRKISSKDRCLIMTLGTYGLNNLIPNVTNFAFFLRKRFSQVNIKWNKLSQIQKKIKAKKAIKIYKSYTTDNLLDKRLKA